MQKIQLFTNYTVVKILLFYKNILGVDKWGLLVVYKKTAFLQKDIFVRKLLFYVKILPNNCKKSSTTLQVKVLAQLPFGQLFWLTRLFYRSSRQLQNFRRHGDHFGRHGA